MKEQDPKDILNLEIRLSEDEKIVGWFECPRCGEKHPINDPEEKKGISLYCDTFNERLPFSDKSLEWLKEEVSKLSINERDFDARKGAYLEVNFFKKAIGIKKQF